MSYQFDFDPASKILRCRIDGPLTDALITECYKATDRYVTVTNPLAGILDLTGITSFETTSRTIQMLAEMPPAFRDTSRLRIIIASDDCSFGMSRMFQQLGEATRPNMHVVRSSREAYLLLGVQEPEFVSVNLDASSQSVRPKVNG